jgi:hypothetical protein
MHYLMSFEPIYSYCWKIFHGVSCFYICSCSVGATKILCLDILNFQTHNCDSATCFLEVAIQSINLCYCGDRLHLRGTIHTNVILWLSRKHDLNRTCLKKANEAMTLQLMLKSSFWIGNQYVLNPKHSKMLMELNQKLHCLLELRFMVWINNTYKLWTSTIMLVLCSSLQKLFR